MSKRWMRTLCVLGAILMLSGCETYRVLAFKAGDYDAHLVKAKQKTELALVSNSGGRSWDGNDALRDAYGAYRKAPGPKPCGDAAKAGNQVMAAGGMTVALIGFAVDQLLAIGKDAVDSLADEIVENSQVPYSASVILTQAEKSSLKSSCMLLVRSDVPEAKAGSAGSQPATGPAFQLALMLRIKEQGPSAFSIEPIFLQLNRTVAWTGKDKPVDVSVAFNGVAASPGKDGKHDVSQFGSTTFSFKQVPFGTAIYQTDLPKGSGLIASPPDASTAIGLTIAVVETGSAIPNSEKVKAETKALVEAIGPALKTRIENRLELRE